MFFDIKGKVRKLKGKQAKERSIMLDHGIPEDEVDSLHRADDRELYGDWQYSKRLQSYINPNDDSLSTEEPFGFGVYNEIENERLLNALGTLTEEDRALVIHRIVDGIPLKMLADFWGCSYSTIKRRYSGAISKLKKNY